MSNKKIVFFFISIWLVVTMLLVLLKYLHLYPQNIISLNNFLTLGAVLGVILIGIGSNSFAKKQLEINQKTINIELAIRYKDHYTELVKAVRNMASLIGNTPRNDNRADHVNIYNAMQNARNIIIDITQQAEILFDNEVVNVNIHIRKSAEMLFSAIYQMYHFHLVNSRDDGPTSLQQAYQKINDVNEVFLYYLNEDPDTKQSPLLTIYLKHTTLLRLDCLNSMNKKH